MIDLPPGVDPCPSCHAAGCERCRMTGRSHIIRFVFNTSRPGRCLVRVWYGPPGTQRLIARGMAGTTDAYDESIGNAWADEIIASLTDPGIVVDDRRAC